jgi:mRNA interferase MazF
VARSWAPDAGDIVWLNFTPHMGREQAGHRPALVLSPAAYNDRTGLMICCPMTTRIMSYPFEVPLEGDRPSVVLADQVKSFDWRARKAVRRGKASVSELADVRAKIGALIGLE